MNPARIAALGSIKLAVFLAAMWVIFRTAKDPSGIAPLMFGGWLAGSFLGHLITLITVLKAPSRSETAHHRRQILSSVVIMAVVLAAYGLARSLAFSLGLLAAAVATNLSNSICLRLYASRDGTALLE